MTSMTTIPKETAFPEAEYQARWQRLREIMRARGLDALLVHHPPNVYYLSGYYSKVMYYNECVVVPLDGRPVLLVLEWERGAAQVNAWLEQVVSFAALDDAPQALATVLHGLDLAGGRIGVEQWSAAVTARKYGAMQTALPRADLVDASGVVEQVRLYKSALEIAYIREAARLSDLGMEAAIGAAAAGRTDNDVAAAAYAAIIGAGGEFMAMDPLVLSGARSGVMHLSHKRVRLQPGDPVIVELGAVFQRYVAPLERTITIGPPDRGTERLIQAANTAFERIVDVLRPGATATDVVQAGAPGIALAGPETFFHGGYAYSIGVAYPPNWVEGSLYVGARTNPVGDAEEVRLQAGMVLNVPISLRVIGQRGAMTGEAVLITEGGCEPLSRLERRLFVR
jgi:Xaa-Pro dipeptidase